MVRIDMQIALRLDRQVDQTVLGQQGQHVIEKADTRRQFGNPAAVQVNAPTRFLSRRFRGEFVLCVWSWQFLNFSFYLKRFAAIGPADGRFPGQCRR